jgi:hypothetical protein
VSACGSGGASSSQPSCGSSSASLTVQGSGQATTHPDTLNVNVGINVTDPTAAAAMGDANDQASKLSDALTAAGVKPSDLQTTGLSINPTYSSTGAITGYQVTNSLLVTMHDLSSAGDVIDAAAASVGSAIQINGLSFSVSNTAKADGEARTSAVRTAASHARVMAAAAGEHLGEICSMSDATTSPSPSALEGLASTSSATAARAAVPLESGTQQATAQVTIVYALPSS